MQPKRQVFEGRDHPKNAGKVEKWKYVNTSACNMSFKEAKSSGEEIENTEHDSPASGQWNLFVVQFTVVQDDQQVVVPDQCPRNKRRQY